MTIFLTTLLLLVGLVLIVKGADFLVDGASALARRFHIPEIVIGLTIVAFGTSMPELTVSLSSALQGSPDMSIGNVVGSNIANILLILGICVLVGKVAVPKKTLKQELPFLAGSTALLFWVVGDNLFGKDVANVLGRFDAAVFLLFFAGFLFYVFRLAKSGKIDTETTEEKHRALWLVIGMIIVGLVMLIGGGTLAVNNAAKIAAMLGMSEAMIGLTILAVGTSAPEIVTSIVATRKGATDLAIGNVVGSNIFNLLLILGLTGVISPIPFNASMRVDIILSFAITVALFILTALSKKRTLPKWSGVFFLLVYVGYLIFLIQRG
jgi:cation:H+ antiporter